ncbi:hypothetical protein LXA43DRAFT_1064488 [Ganoderma leucocontextum]|nr:hypothetical protein LXA43DRAFT_1064995 [Ganoderma leucocontextum]KAI1787309.1 hypothetical protein LXA43DRAFT_1064488 [Ganoderma leucocontextum]
MSSTEHPSAPRTPPPLAEASEVNDDNRGQPSAEQSSSTFPNFQTSPLKACIPHPTNRKAIEAHQVVQDASICEDFLAQHLRTTPTPFTLTDVTGGYVSEICKAGTSEWKMYKPAAALLTAISKEVYRSFSEQQKNAHKKRQHIRKGRPGHLTFIDHHSTAPTHFPNLGCISNTKDAPDLLGVYDVDVFKDGKDAQGVYKGVPHHRVEAIVEAKSETNGGGRRQAATYAYRHHQARPDRPGFYLLVIKPQWYQVLYSDPTGLFASPQTPWANMDLLVAYVYSHYEPPDAHFLWDETIRWSESNGPCTFPSWKIQVKGEWYTDGQFIFVGEPWSRLTTTFDTVDANGEHVIIKDGYRHDGRRFKEEEILDHLHAEGDLLGVVRLKVHETLGRFSLKGPAAERSRVRFVLLDTGSEFLKAKTLNDLLKATYDALEVHRTKLVQRNVLHRDMSLYNMLMYPVWGSMKGRHVNENSPPTVQDILSGENRSVEDRFPACLAIDYDNAALLDYKNTKPQELMQRTGTPMYIARSVCIGSVLTDDMHRIIPRMPELSEKARDLYIGAHGKERYERHNDTKATPHGACPPDPEEGFETPPTFCHRPEHDVESIYWSMVSALLHVRPVEAEGEPETTEYFQDAWKFLLWHKIPDADEGYHDQRQLFLNQKARDWGKLFLGGMKDIGTLLWNISRQVRPEYALCGDGLQRDHLHEAVQRLILQYLVDHDDIALVPERLRPIPEKSKPTVTRPSKQVTTKGSGAGSAAKSRATRASRASENTGTGSATKRKSVVRDAAQSDGSVGSSTSVARATGVPSAVVVDPKRKSSSQTGRSSKRLRNNSGLPQSIEDRVEGDA